MSRHGWKNTTGSYNKLDIRKLQRGGFLRPGTTSRLYWSLRGEEIGSIQVRAEWWQVILRYRHQRRGSDEWTNEEYPVAVEWTPCHFGGERAWFLCPARGCGRRVATLWGGEIFACRQCHNLAYDSQNETAHSRALGKVQAIRVKLGGEPAGDFPPKPKGMHWRTYRRWRQKADEAEDQSWPPMILRMLSGHS